MHRDANRHPLYPRRPSTPAAASSGRRARRAGLRPAVLVEAGEARARARRVELAVRLQRGRLGGARVHLAARAAEAGLVLALGVACFGVEWCFWGVEFV